MMTQSTVPTIYDYYGSMSVASSDEAAPEETKENSKLGKEDFMTLLLVELQNQDPLNPMDNTEFVAQLAQFSSLEQMVQMNDTLEENLALSEEMNSAISTNTVINYFGKNITAETSDFIFPGEEDSKLELIFELEKDIISGTLTIKDAEGETVLTKHMEDFEAGLTAYVWDGIMNDGELAESGMYSYDIEAYNSDGDEVGITYLYNDVVTGIYYEDGEAYLNLNGVEVALSDVRAIASDTSAVASEEE